MRFDCPLLTILAVAVALEAGGDALLRGGLYTVSVWQCAVLFGLAAVVEFAYGWTVNAPPSDFGNPLGLCVVFFFIFAQTVSWIVFKQAPSGAVLVGGGLIVAGGVVIAAASV